MTHSKRDRLSKRDQITLARLAAYDLTIPQLLRDLGEDEEFVQDVEDLFYDWQ